MRESEARAEQDNPIIEEELPSVIAAAKDHARRVNKPVNGPFETVAGEGGEGRQRFAVGNPVIEVGGYYI